MTSMKNHLRTMCENEWFHLLQDGVFLHYKREVLYKDSALKYKPHEMFELIELDEYDIVYYSYCREML